MRTPSLEGLRDNLLEMMVMIETKADDTLWYTDGETIFEHLASLYLEHGGDQKILKETFPNYF
jgi:hypothetical protein